MVYNPESKTWIRADSLAGKEIPTSTNPQFGKTAEEVRSQRVRKAREEAKKQEEKKQEFIYTISDGDKTTRLKGSEAFGEKLKTALQEEEAKRQEERK